MALIAFFKTLKSGAKMLSFSFWFYQASNNHSGVFRTHSPVYDGAFVEILNSI